jgi:predicted phage tail protein
MENLVKVNLFGDLGDKIGREWEFAANSVGECIRGIELATKKLYKYLLKMDKKGAKYRIIINGEDFICHKKGTLGLDDLETVRDSGLSMNYNDLKTIDIVPILEGNGSKILGIFTTIIGIILIIVGIILIETPIGGALIVAGLGLLAAGVMTLLSRPPKFAPFQQAPNGVISYLFSGPTNTTREGGPVPIGYGRLLIGSQVISAAYIVQDYNIADNNIIANAFPTNRMGGDGSRTGGDGSGGGGIGGNQTFTSLQRLYRDYSQKHNSNLTYNAWYNKIYLPQTTTQINKLTTSYTALQSGVNPNQTLSNVSDNNVNTIN